MAAVKKVDTVTLKDLAASLAETHSLPKAQANIMLTEMVANVGKHLKKGSRIRIPGLGILQVRKRAARDGSQPGNGRNHQDQGQQEDRFQGVEGPQGSRDVDVGNRS